MRIAGGDEGLNSDVTNITQPETSFLGGLFPAIGTWFSENIWNIIIAIIAIVAIIFVIYSMVKGD
jgi:type II secretory pathway component PulF